MKKLPVIIYAYSLPLLLLFSSVVIYFLIFNIISIDPRIVSSYATEGKYDYNVYFSKDVDTSTDIYNTLLVSQDSSPSYTRKSHDRIQEVCKYILDNKVSVIKRIEKNKSYIAYLEGKQLNTDDLLIYVSIPMQ